MNKRLAKKLRTNDEPLRLEGNNGGDFVEIETLQDGRVHIRSGCSCVMMMDAVVPNEFLSILIKECILNYGSVQEFIKQSNYEDKYKQELIDKFSDLGGK